MADQVVCHPMRQLNSIFEPVLTSLVSASNEACPPVTEFYNPNGAGTGSARDWIFLVLETALPTLPPCPWAVLAARPTGAVSFLLMLPAIQYGRQQL